MQLCNLAYALNFNPGKPGEIYHSSSKEYAEIRETTMKVWFWVHRIEKFSEQNSSQ